MIRKIFPLVLLLLPWLLVSRELPECVRTESNGLVFPGDRSAQDGFYVKLDSLISSGEGNVNIWHIGGSHVQAAYFPNRIMNDLDSIAPRGDRGFLFPRRLCKTNSDKSYRISYTGEWVAPMMTLNSKLDKPRYGITGFGARTSDSRASVSFNVSPDADSLWSFKTLRVLGYGTSSDARPYLVDGTDTLRHCYDTLTASYLFDLPRSVDSVTVAFDIPDGETFTLTGLQPISGRSGVNYYSSGVNGAKLSTWLDKCPDLERDLGIVHPDLAILALGINDSACMAKDFKPERFKDNYRRLIAMIRRVSPDCALIFITNNDSYRYVRKGMTYNENAPAVRKAMMELAEEYGAGVWDLYGIMGGAHSVQRWKNLGLVKPDRLHFTDEGYTLLGDLFFEALMEDRQAAK